MPEDSQELRRQVEHRKLPSISQWPRGWESIVALAQHYGLPTRLLDWSWEPKVAAYFAAASAKKKRLAVYALRSAACDPHDRKHLGIRFSGGSLDRVTAAGAGNQNLRAQEGVFTVWKPTEITFPQPFEPLEEIVKTAEVSEDPSFTLLRRFTLPAKHSRYLLYRLKQEGVSGSSVWPGYRGVADEIEQDFLEPAADHCM